MVCLGRRQSLIRRERQRKTDPLTLNSKRRNSRGRFPLGRDANTIQHQRGSSIPTTSRMERIGRRWIVIFPMVRSRGVDEVNDRRRGSQEHENGGLSMYVGIN